MKISVTLTRSLVFSLLVCMFMVTTVRADRGSDMNHLEQRWAEVNYQLEGKTQLAAFEQLRIDADTIAEANPDSAEVLVWSGIIKSSYAAAKGWLGGWSLAKVAKADLENAISIDSAVLGGAAQAALGDLYSRLPGWPLAFGDDAHAEESLLQALALNPDGIDANYYYGKFLIEQNRYQEARQHLIKAKTAQARPGRALAYAGRQKEISNALQEINGK